MQTSVVPYLDTQDQLAAQRRYYRRGGKEIILRKKQEARERNREYVQALKSMTPCADCLTQFHPAAMQFDHLRDKRGDIAKMAASPVSLETLKAEIAKCEIVCANCHAIRTATRRSPIV